MERGDGWDESDISKSSSSSSTSTPFTDANTMGTETPHGFPKNVNPVIGGTGGLGVAGLFSKVASFMFWGNLDNESPVIVDPHTAHSLRLMTLCAVTLVVFVLLTGVFLYRKFSRKNHYNAAIYKGHENAEMYRRNKMLKESQKKKE